MSTLPVLDTFAPFMATVRHHYFSQFQKLNKNSCRHEIKANSNYNFTENSKLNNIMIHDIFFVNEHYYNY